jgi:hypothetical protein
VLAEQKVLVRHPLLGERPRLRCRPTVGTQALIDHATTFGHVHLLKIARADRARCIGCLPAMKPARVRQALNHGAEERSGSAGRLNRPKRSEITLAGVSHQVKNQLDDPAPGKHGAIVVSLLHRGGQRSRMGFVGKQLSLYVGHPPSLQTGRDGSAQGKHECQAGRSGPRPNSS